MVKTHGYARLTYLRPWAQATVGSGCREQRGSLFGSGFWSRIIYVDGPDLSSVQNINSLAHEFQDILPVVKSRAKFTAVKRGLARHEHTRQAERSLTTVQGLCR